MESQKILILITHRDGDGDGYTRACFAFKLAVIFVNMGVDTVVYLGGAASVLAQDGRAQPVNPIDNGENIRSYIDDFILNQGKIFVCCACYMSHCGIHDERDMKKTLIKGMECGGIAAMAGLSLESKVFTF